MLIDFVEGKNSFWVYGSTSDNAPVNNSLSAVMNGVYIDVSSSSSSSYSSSNSSSSSFSHSSSSSSISSSSSASASGSSSSSSSSSSLSSQASFEQLSEEEESEEWNQSELYVCAPSRCTSHSESESECGSSKNPCVTVNEVLDSERYKSEEFTGWVVLMEGEHGKENKQIIAVQTLKMRGGEGVVKIIGGIEGGEGMLCGNEIGLCLERITMKEIEGDCMNIPLVVWNGGYVNMSGIEIIRIGGGGSSIVMEVSESRASTVV